jgi:NO-binding membrane sensor protein with MHYT domain/anti-sigma regulatory factor (Ser/Thr protein kinase)
MTSPTILIGSYNPYFVSLSVVVAIIASAASLDVADRIGRSEGWLRAVWTAASGVAMGGGIWAMHFIAILALLLPVPVAYDVPTTLGSLALSITVTGAAFAIVCGATYSVRRLAIGGLIMGLGVAGMHYTGMDAMRLPAIITYDPFLFLASVAIAVVAATAALWIAVRVTGFAWRLAAALVMGLAVASMHFTGMAATCFSGRAGALPLEHGLDRGSLALAVAAGALVILSLELVSAAVDRRFAQLRQQETDESRRAQDLAEAALVELRATQKSLIQAEKMASLSRLTAGIAHEINTPIGPALTATTTLLRRTDEFVESVRTGRVTKSAALKYAEIASESSSLIVSNIGPAATLIQSFKQVAVDQTSGECRQFGLAEYLLEIVHSLTPRLKQTLHKVDIYCPAGVLITSYPGALAQVITNLIMNSLVHVFPDAYVGVISLVARPYQDDMVELIYSDNGVGIPDSDRARVFDPFFTTRRAQGGTGLGLHIVYNIVTQTLMGTITLETRPGRTCFDMLLPVIADRPVNMVNTL